MTHNQITQALKDSLVYEAFMYNSEGAMPNIDNCSMLLAVATGKAFSYSEVYAYIFNPSAED